MGCADVGSLRGRVHRAPYARKPSGEKTVRERITQEHGKAKGSLDPIADTGGIHSPQGQQMRGTGGCQAEGGVRCRPCAATLRADVERRLSLLTPRSWVTPLLHGGRGEELSRRATSVAGEAGSESRGVKA